MAERWAATGSWLRRWRQSGAGLTEYGLVLVLISTVAITTMAVAGNQVNNLYQVAANAVVNP